MSQKEKLNKEELEKVNGSGWFSNVWTNVKGVTKDIVNEITENKETNNEEENK